MKYVNNIVDIESGGLMTGEAMDVLLLGYTEIIQKKGVQVNLSSTLFILVINGSGVMEINFKRYQIHTGEMVLLSFAHFFKIHTVSTDFRCLLLNISQDFVDEMFSTDMLYKRVKYGVKMHRIPILKLQNEEAQVLQKRIQFVKEMISNTVHPFYKGMGLSALQLFLYDLTYIIEKDEVDDNTLYQSREDIYFQQFLDLLVRNYRMEHKVDFYADKLNITTHYLTLIVKRLTKQTVSELIFQLLFSEAKILLQQPNWSIQQIAEKLAFSDQSAFGKFFKRWSGVSPKIFRTKMLQKT